jgi:hypothetical protein
MVYCNLQGRVISFLSCPMQVRTHLATCKTAIWISPSHHTIFRWVQVTHFGSKLQMVSFRFFNKHFSQSSTYQFSKPRRRKKRIKETIEANIQKFFIIILSSKRKFNFEDSNIFSMSLNTMLKKNQHFLEQNLPFRIKSCYSQGHHFRFSIHFHCFINHFLIVLILINQKI